MESETDQITLYKKDDIIYAISKLLEYYNESKNKQATIKAAHLLMDKVRCTDMDVIKLESNFIEEILFILNEDGTKTIAEDVFFRLRELRADLKGVSFDGVYVSYMRPKGFKGEIIINPQKVPDKDVSGIDFNGVKLIGDYDEVNGLYADPCFYDCIIYESSFKGCIGNIVIALDKIKSHACLCNFTGVKLTGKIDNYKLFASYYEDDNGNGIYLTNYEDYESEKKVAPKKKSRVLTFFDRFKGNN